MSELLIIGALAVAVYLLLGKRLLENVKVDLTKVLVSLRVTATYAGRTLATYTLEKRASELVDYADDYFTVRYDAVHRLLKVSIDIPYMESTEVVIPLRPTAPGTVKPLFSVDVHGVTIAGTVSIRYVL